MSGAGSNLLALAITAALLRLAVFCSDEVWASVANQACLWHKVRDPFVVPYIWLQVHALKRSCPWAVSSQ